MIRAAAALVIVLLAAVAALADPPGGELKYTPPAAPAPPDPTGLLLRLFGLTAGMVALCAGSVWLARRVNRPRAAAGAPGADRIRHRGSLMLDRRGTVHLYDVDGQAVAVTTDASGLRSIVVLSEPLDAASADADPAAPTSS